MKESSGWNLKRIRNKVITDMYYDFIHENGFCSIKSYAKWLVTQPAPRFYIEYENARRFVSLIIKGQRPKCSPAFYELAERLRQRADLNKRYKFILLNQLLTEEAPSFYLSEDRIIGIVYSEMRSRLRIK